MNMLHNYPLMSALLAIVTAQFIKVPIYFITHGQWSMRLAFGTGGMPSSHSAGAVSLAAAVGIREGVSSSAFAIALMVSIITMYDAAGIRRHAGTHASVLNRMTRTLSALRNEQEEDSTLKEKLGHRPAEVCVGACFGIAVSIVIKLLFY